MNKEEYLSQAAVLGRKIAKIEMNIGFYREAACSPASSSNDEPRVSKSRSTEAPFARMVLKIADMELKVEKLKEERDKLLDEISTVIERCVDNKDYKALLILRYLQDLEWEMICAKLCVARATAHRWHQAALKRIVIPNQSV